MNIKEKLQNLINTCSTDSEVDINDFHVRLIISRAINHINELEQKLYNSYPESSDLAQESDYSNEPDEIYYGPESIIDTGSDLHKRKKSYKKAAGGDNPMSLEEKIRAIDEGRIN